MIHSIMLRRLLTIFCCLSVACASFLPLPFPAARCGASPAIALAKAPACCCGGGVCRMPNCPSKRARTANGNGQTGSVPCQCGLARSTNPGPSVSCSIYRMAAVAIPQPTVTCCSDVVMVRIPSTSLSALGLSPNPDLMPPRSI